MTTEFTRTPKFTGMGMTPGQARALAQGIIEAADRADGNQ